MDYLYSALAGCIVGAVGTCGGAALSFLVKKSNNRLSAILMGISAGTMLAVVFFDMWPESFEMSGWIPCLISTAIGAVFVHALHLLFPHGEKSPGRQPREIGNRHGKRASYMEMGALICMGIAIHNLPEGIAVGSGLAKPGDFGFGLALLLMIHNIPEGAAMGIPLKLGGMGRCRILLYAFLVGFPTAIGALIGRLVGNISPMLIGAAMAFAAGAMLYVTLKELIPESAGMGKVGTTLWSVLLGLGIGAIIVFLI